MEGEKIADQVLPLETPSFYETQFDAVDVEDQTIGTAKNDNEKP